jgi:hypothetical protein
MRAEREEDIVWRTPPPKELKEIDLWAVGVGLALKENEDKWGIVYHGDDAYTHYRALYHNNTHVWCEIVNIRNRDDLYAIYSTKNPKG